MLNDVSGSIIIKRKLKNVYPPSKRLFDYVSIKCKTFSRIGLVIVNTTLWFWFAKPDLKSVISRENFAEVSAHYHLQLFGRQKQTEQQNGSNSSGRISKPVCLNKLFCIREERGGGMNWQKKVGGGHRWDSVLQVKLHSMTANAHSDLQPKYSKDREQKVGRSKLFLNSSNGIPEILVQTPILKANLNSVQKNFYDRDTFSMHIE